MADETMTEDVFTAHMERAVRRSQEIWPDDWRNHHTFYDGEVARLLDTLRQAADEPRAIIRHFAAAMERKLAANDATKGTWRYGGTFYLLGAMHLEVNEFVDALNIFVNLEDDGAPDDILAKSRQALRDEAADVANYLAMVLDVCGALPPTDERGR